MRCGWGQLRPYLVPERQVRQGLVVRVEHEARARVEPSVEVDFLLPARARLGRRNLQGHFVPHLDWWHRDRPRRGGKGEAGERRNPSRRKPRDSVSHRWGEWGRRMDFCGEYGQLRATDRNQRAGHAKHAVATSSGARVCALSTVLGYLSCESGHDQKRCHTCSSAAFVVIDRQQEGSRSKPERQVVFQGRGLDLVVVMLYASKWSANPVGAGRCYVIVVLNALSLTRAWHPIHRRATGFVRMCSQVT